MLPTTSRPKFAALLVAPIWLLPHSMMITNTVLFWALAPNAPIMVDYGILLIAILVLNAVVSLIPLRFQGISLSLFTVLSVPQILCAALQFIAVVYEISERGFNSPKGMYLSGFTGFVTYPLYEISFLFYCFCGLLNINSSTLLASKEDVPKEVEFPKSHGSISDGLPRYLNNRESL